MLKDNDARWKADIGNDLALSLKWLSQDSHRDIGQAWPSAIEKVTEAKQHMNNALLKRT